MLYLTLKRCTFIYLVPLVNFCSLKQAKYTPVTEPSYPKNKHTMASSPSLLSFSITFLLLLTWFPYKTLPQNPGNSPSGPTVAGCGTSLLPLVPCAPFVQGSVPSPAQQCCDNLKQFYNQQPNCLCFLLNNTALRSFPINRTLALQLPLLCNLQVDISACSGVYEPQNFFLFSFSGQFLSMSLFYNYTCQKRYDCEGYRKES
ncbi:unnamed protein product [Ilex paraguariensis]|uniref:Bifunctional inhibitor/plant lipid transfer protein/seed storage helical domain-containing protein n=1 Tax=Ilex paraguariensis TaxID=185542 RepID=A0ABC8RVY9_9AQUA